MIHSAFFATRLTNLNDYFTYMLYKAVCRSLFEKDKLMFSFLLAARIAEGAGQLDMTEWRFLLTGVVGVSSSDGVPNPAPDWLEERAWVEIGRLGDLSVFGESFVSDFAADIHAWRAIYDSFEPHTEVFPGKLGGELSPFHKTLLVSVVRSWTPLGSPCERHSTCRR